MFVKTVIRQGEKIHKLESDLKLEKEENEELRNENLEISLELRRLQIFKEKITEIMKKGTIVEKHDKIKELVDKLESEN